MMAYDYPHPVSRTYQYKKITKPLLERKRRARINRCLDELKDLMVDALETEGENISKLEKADILELTVRHLQRLHASRPSGLTSGLITNDDSSGESRWQSGFGHCAAEACKYLAALPGESGEKLARHLASGLQSTRKLNIQIMPKDELLSPVLASSDANSQSHSPEIPPISTASSSVAVKISPLPQSTPLPNEEPIEPPNKKLCNTPLTKNEPMASMVSEDDEEIDVERVDDRDPMWRPW